MREAGNVDHTSGAQRLSVRLGSHEFAIGVERVRELRGYTELTPVPQSPPYVSGLLDLRGMIIPVIDLALRLGMPPSRPNAKSVIVVVESERGLAGLLVDEVCDLFSTADHPLHASPVLACASGERFVVGAVALESRIVNVLCTENIVELERYP